MHSKHYYQSGSSLFEVLVSVLILGLGLLGVVAVQTSALRNAGYSLQFSDAARQGQAMVEIMRSRRSAALAGQYHTGGFVCDAQASGEIGRWIGDLQNTLGETACGEIVCQAGTTWCKVTVRWGSAPSQTGESIPHELTIGARL